MTLNKSNAGKVMTAFGAASGLYLGYRYFKELKAKKDVIRNNAATDEMTTVIGSPEPVNGSPEPEITEIPSDTVIPSGNAERDAQLFQIYHAVLEQANDRISTVPNPTDVKLLKYPLVESEAVIASFSKATPTSGTLARFTDDVHDIEFGVSTGSVRRVNLTTYAPAVNKKMGMSGSTLAFLDFMGRDGGVFASIPIIR